MPNPLRLRYWLDRKMKPEDERLVLPGLLSENQPAFSSKSGSAPLSMKNPGEAFDKPLETDLFPRSVVGPDQRFKIRL